MRRYWIIVTLISLLVLTSLSIAQETDPIAQPEATAEVIAPDVVAPEATAEPEPVQLFSPEVLDLLVGARSDLELMALEIGGINRPEGWNGNLDINNPQLPLLVRLDLELLSAVVLGETVRPDGWFGAIPSTQFSIARDIRHDIELLAEIVYAQTQRPEGWSGTPSPLYLCGRATQTLVSLLSRGGIFTVSADPTSPDYCAQAEIEAVRFSEQNLLSNEPNEPIFASRVQANLPGAITIDTQFAVAFLDRGASLSVGVVPAGTPVLPIARSYANFSNMILVQNDEFVLFMDFRDTTLSEEQFEALPNVDGYTGGAPFCTARWCN